MSVLLRNRPGRRLLGGAETASITVGTPGLLRAMNERTVLDLIHRQGPVSRAQVARVTGLSKPTVSLALTELLDSHLVREVGRARGDRGPSAVLYELNPRAGWVAGIDVGRRWVRAAVADITGTIVARRDERARVGSAKTLIGQIGSMARRLAADAGIEWSDVTHATLGSPGVFDPSHGYVALAPNLPGWGRGGLVEAVRSELGTNVSFENDVNLAALAEREHGLGQNVENFVFLSIGTGIGLGIVIGGRVYRGAHGAAGEIAYLPVGGEDAHGPGIRRHGAMEDVAAAGGLVRMARRLGMKSAVTPEQIFTAARRGDANAVRTVQAEARVVSLAIAGIAPVLDPELVVLGGGIGRNGDLLVEPIERELHDTLPFRPRVAVSMLGDDAVVLGAIATALDVARDRVFARSPVRAGVEAAG